MELPNHVGHDYYNGGKYYKYPNGVSVFYDEITREVSNIMVGGRTFIKDLASVELLLGNPIDQGYDEFEQENYKTYLIKPYEVTVYSTESGEFSYIWLRGN